MTPEELIYRIPSLVCKRFYLNCAGNNARELYRTYEAKEVSSDTLLAFIDGIDTIDTTDGEPFYEKIDDDGMLENRIYVRLEQWPLIMVLLGEYRKKYEKLFPEQQNAITSSMYRKIAQACVKHANPDRELASAVRDILLEFVVKQNDKVD
jgi:hypothetical protein